MEKSHIKRFAKVKTENGEWIVSIMYRKNGEHVFGCSCPAWKFRKTGDPEGYCKHIRGLLSGEVVSSVKDIEILDKDVFDSLRFIQKLV